MLSQGTVTWCCHMVLSQGAVTGCCHRVLSHGAVTGYCHMVLSQGTVTWCCHRVLSHGAVTGCCHMVLSQGAVRVSGPGRWQCLVPLLKCVSGGAILNLYLKSAHSCVASAHFFDHPLPHPLAPILYITYFATLLFYCLQLFHQFVCLFVLFVSY